MYNQNLRIGSLSIYDYKFVEVQVGSLTGKPKEDYQAIINEHALECWCYTSSNQ
ncbi:DUF4177 domain-containing protein [Rummeliibacillus sp. NPDC094406]|uniref:DUF4177 domain-containing protein n=1 Tax=Rummeliibacillus sp. NPDC094406 TaxID=3364511 RepID=UPI0038153B02